MTRMPFVKMEGAGNDYVYVDGGITGAGIDPDAIEDWGGLARRISDRHRGVGSDGLILVFPGRGAPIAMRMWNADGSEGLLCLNGLRCTARLAVTSRPGLGDVFEVETAAGLRAVRVLRDGRGVPSTVEVKAGRPDFRRRALPALGEGEELWEEVYPTPVGQLSGYGVSVGNPHLVLRLDSEARLGEAPLAAIGAPLAADPRFPEGVNVHLVAEGAEGSLVMRTWERGSGATLACGSGAVAVFAVARRCGFAGAEAEVRMPGGQVRLRADSEGRLLLRGDAREIFRGTWPLEGDPG
jgi:diaminopimelate epimerase